MSEQGDTILSEMANHFKAKKVKTTTVPEWGDVTIYANPVSVMDAQRIAGFQDRPTSQIGEAAIDTLILLARNKDGKKLFTKAHKPKMLRSSDFSILARVVAALVEDIGTEVDDLQSD